MINDLLSDEQKDRLASKAWRYYNFIDPDESEYKFLWERKSDETRSGWKNVVGAVMQELDDITKGE